MSSSLPWNNTFDDTNIELETTLTYSLPLKVGQGRLLETFWALPYDIESFVYRCTRYGNGKWRIGELRRWKEEDRRRKNMDRLDILRVISGNCDTATAEDNDKEIISELKLWLNTDRTFVYDDNIPLFDNSRYPLILEDRLSAEVKLDDYLNEVLLNVENDTSDNNMGIKFMHRLSFYIFLESRNKRQLPVRVSLRSTLNEFHEISYSFELECESLPLVEKYDVEREIRHASILEVFRKIVLPLLREHWPVGLRLDSVQTPLPQQILDDFDRVSLFELRTARSSRNEESLIRAVQRTKNAILLKRKYDGERKYAFYRGSNVFSIDGSIVSSSDEDDNNDDVFSGLFVYQVEAFDRRRQRLEKNGVLVVVDDEKDDERKRHYVITEVIFALDHKYLFEDSGGGALQRKIEHSEYQPSTEQKDPNISYLLERCNGGSINDDDQQKTTNNDKNPWLRVFERLIKSNVLSALECFLRDSVASYGSYVYPYESPYRSSFSSKKTIVRDDNNIDVAYLRNSTEGRFRMSQCVQHIAEECSLSQNIAASIPPLLQRYLEFVKTENTNDKYCNFNRDYSFHRKSFITLRPIVSNFVLLRTHETHGGKYDSIKKTHFIRVSKPYFELFETNIIDAAAMATVSTDQNNVIFRNDGYLILHSNKKRLQCKDSDHIYNKLKLYQTVELGISWSRCFLSTRNDASFAHQIVSPLSSQTINFFGDNCDEGNENFDNDDGSSSSCRKKKIIYWALNVNLTQTVATKWKRSLVTDNTTTTTVVFRTIDIPMPIFNDVSASSSNNTTRIGEFQYIDSGYLRFIGWRDDKDVADSTTKAIRIIFD